MQGLAPYATAGTQALGQQGDLLGLHGNDPQAAAIASLQDSPLFKALYRSGLDTNLNNASATGGLRGGNEVSSLANFGSDTLASVIQQQLAQLQGVSGQGLGATQFGAGLGANAATQVAGLDTGSGSANAGAILNKQAVSNNMFSQLQGLATSALGGGAGGGLSSILSGLFGGAGGGLGASTGPLPNFPKINVALPSASAGLPGF